MSAIHEQCRANCLKYALCEKMEQKGQANISGAERIALGTDGRAREFGRDVDFVDDDGNLVSGDEFFGTVPSAPKLAKAGELMIEGANGLKAGLLEGCELGPLVIPGTYDQGGNELAAEHVFCQSANSRAVDFTEADLQN
jgi:hypothetical protein